MKKKFLKIQNLKTYVSIAIKDIKMMDFTQKNI